MVAAGVRGRVRLAVRVLAVVGLTTVPFWSASPAAAAVTSSSATGVADAMTAAGTVTTGASWASVTGGTPNGVSDAPLGGFPTEGSSFAILTTGDVNDADEAPPSTHAGTTTENGGANVRGDSDFDVSVLKVDFTVAAGMNCVSFDFRFFTEEYPEYLTSDYNDAFIAELDTSDWSTSGSTITAPHNIAFDSANQPISVHSLGDTSMTAGPSDTTYDGATPVLTASSPAAPGAHSLYLSIFDQLDERVDSAVFLDNLIVGHAVDRGQCAPGAEPKNYTLTLAPPTGTHAVGASHAVTATVEELGDGPFAGGTVRFSVSGANSADGTATTDAGGLAQFSYIGTTAGGDTISACLDADKSGTCDVGEPFASVTATWTVAPAGGGDDLPDTGQRSGLIAGLGLLVLVLGVGVTLIARRRGPRASAQ